MRLLLPSQETFLLMLECLQNANGCSPSYLSQPLKYKILSFLSLPNPFVPCRFISFAQCHRLPHFRRSQESQDGKRSKRTPSNFATSSTCTTAKGTTLCGTGCVTIGVTHVKMGLDYRRSPSPYFKLVHTIGRATTNAKRNKCSNVRYCRGKNWTFLYCFDQLI